MSRPELEKGPSITADMTRKKLYYKRWWKQVGFANPSKNRLVTLHRYSRIVSSLSTRSSVILDVGCGNGAFLRILESEGCKHLIGVDLENVFLQSGKISFIVADPTRLPLRPESVDFVFARKFVSIADVRKSVSEMCSVMMSDGKLLIDVPNVERLKSRIYTMLGLEPTYSGARYFPHLRLKSFMKIFSENGLMVLQSGGDYVEIPFFGRLIARFRDGIILRAMGHRKPALCSHIFAVCQKKDRC